MNFGFIFSISSIFLVFSIATISNCIGTLDRLIPAYDRLIFYNEILYQVEQPLTIQKWIRNGESFLLDKALYTEWTEYMERFYQDILKSRLLRQSNFFGLLIKSHQIQTLGLYEILVKSPTWEYFVQSSCWARQHTHPHMFVFAFTKAILERGNQAELLPFIYEILPRHFFDRRLVSAAIVFESTKWIGLKLNSEQRTASNEDHDDWIPIKLWNMKRYNEEPSNAGYQNDEEINSILPKKARYWWKADDDKSSTHLKFGGHQRILSYLTEDADWNAYWYFVSMSYSPIVRSFSSSAWKKTIYAEHWFFFLDNFLTRYYLERLSHGLGAIPDLNWDQYYEVGEDTKLIAISNRSFHEKASEWTPKNNGVHFKRIRETIDFIKGIIDAGEYTLRNGTTTIDLRKPEAIGYIMELLHCHLDPNGNIIESHWYSLAHMYFGNIDDIALDVKPHVMLNFETMARDPFFYVFHKEIIKVYRRFQSYLPSYTSAELHGFKNDVTILDVNITKLMTFDEIFDFDVTNLMMTNNHSMWSENLLARRVRLNHRPFHLNVTIHATQHHRLILRFFIAPKFDEYGRVIPLDMNRQNFIELTNTVRTVHAGINILTFLNADIFVRKQKFNVLQSQIYYCAVSAHCRRYIKLYTAENKNCGLDNRLMLPRGWSSNGLPLQLFVIATEIDGNGAQLWWRPCSMRVGKGTTLGYPFDRHILNEHDFIGSNMLLKDIKIYHEDKTAERSTIQQDAAEVFQT